MISILILLVQIIAMCALGGLDIFQKLEDKFTLGVVDRQSVYGNDYYFYDDSLRPPAHRKTNGPRLIDITSLKKSY